jgi:DNA polymerase-1
MGMPATMAKHSKLPRDLIEDFQRRYFSAFPKIREWHGWVRAQLLQHGYITSLLGRRRWFFGRRNDDSVVREAVAYEPQSITSDVLNCGMLHVWRAGICQILLQVHDSILIQYPEELEPSVVPRVISLLEIPVELKNGRKLIIPADAKVGWNWSDHAESNPDGLKKWTGERDERRRQPETSILHRSLSGIY